MVLSVDLVVIIMVLKTAHCFEFAKKNTIISDQKENIENNHNFVTNQTNNLPAKMKKDVNIYNETLLHTNVTTNRESTNDLFNIIGNNLQKSSQINQNEQIGANNSNNASKPEQFSNIVASNVLNIVDSEYLKESNASKILFYDREPNINRSSTKYTIKKILTNSLAKPKPSFRRVESLNHTFNLDNKTRTILQAVKKMFPTLEQNQLSEIIYIFNNKDTSVLEKKYIPNYLVSGRNISFTIPDILNVNSNYQDEITKPDNQALHLYSLKASSVPFSNTGKASEIIMSKQSEASRQNVSNTNSFDVNTATRISNTSGPEFGLLKKKIKYPENNLTLNNSTYVIGYKINDYVLNSTTIPISEDFNKNISASRYNPQFFVFEPSKNPEKSQENQQNEQWYMTGNPLYKLLTLTNDPNPPLSHSSWKGIKPFSVSDEINISSKYSAKDYNNNNNAKTNGQDSGLFTNLLKFPENNSTIHNSTHFIWYKIDNNKSNSNMIPIYEALNKNISTLRKVPQLFLFKPSKIPEISHENQQNVQWYMTGNPLYKLLTLTNDLNPLRIGCSGVRGNTSFSVSNRMNINSKSNNLQEIPSKIYEQRHMYLSPQVILPQSVLQSLETKPGQNEDKDKFKDTDYEAFDLPSLETEDGRSQPMAIPWASPNSIFTSTIEEQPTLKDEPEGIIIQQTNVVPKVKSQIPYPQHQIKTELSVMHPYYATYSTQKPLLPVLQPESENLVNIEYNVRQPFKIHEPIMIDTIDNVIVPPLKLPSTKTNIKNQERTEIVEPAKKDFTETQGMLQVAPMSNIEYSKLKTQKVSKPQMTFQFTQIAPKPILPKSHFNAILSSVNQDILSEESRISQNNPLIKLNLLKLIDTNIAKPNIPSKKSIDHSRLKYTNLNVNGSEAKLLLSMFKSQDECGEGTFWIRNCHSCVCREGKAICDKISDCVLRPFGLPMLCKPYSKFTIDGCYSCECNADGVPECKAICDDPSDDTVNTPLPNYDDYKQQFQELNGYDNIYEPNCHSRSNPTCETGTSWVSNCHQCSCDDGEHECTKISDCVLDKKSYGNPGRCKPNSNFNPRNNNMGCASCSCDDEGIPHCKKSIVLTS